MTARLAIVTGASRGIGSATARRVARDFTHVVLVARTPETLATTAAAVREAGAAALPIAADLRDTDAAGRVVGEALAWGGRIDALINIAGAVPQADLFDLTDAQWDDGLALKFHGARRLTLAAWHALRASGGSVVFTSGASADAPKPEFAAVGTINAAIVALAKAFSERGIRDGVQSMPCCQAR